MALTLPFFESSQDNNNNKKELLDHWQKLFLICNIDTSQNIGVEEAYL